MDVDATDAWAITEGEGVVVGVIDTGILYSHPDLSDNIWTNPAEQDNGKDDDKNGFIDDLQGWDFTENDNDATDGNLHGTHVSGTIAAIRGNGHGLIGVAPKAKILPLKVLNDDGAGTEAEVIAAVDYAIRLKQSGVPLRILNASLGGAEYSELFAETLRRANRAGILLVAAAGNSSADNDTTAQYPSNFATELPNVISVAAVERDGSLAQYSNYGTQSVQIAAPGSGIWSTIIFDLYLPVSGTSMAAPHVSGVAALVAAQNPNLTPEELRQRILDTAKPLNTLSGKLVTPGIASAVRALEKE